MTVLVFRASGDEGTVGNRLIQMLQGHALGALEPLVPVPLQARQVVEEPGKPAVYAYFPVTAVVSLLTTVESGASVGIALIGREGMVVLGNVLGPLESPTTAIVQVAGTALRVPTATLREARRANPVVASLLAMYTEALMIQVAQTAACNRLHPVDARLARWLLAMHDRIEGDEFVLSHEVIAEVLGVHRPTVSIAFRRLQKRRAVVRRGRAIVVSQRRELEAVACECHRVVRSTEQMFTRGIDGGELANAPASPATAAGEHETTVSMQAMREIAGRLLLANIREQEAREAAEAANRAKDQFLAMVSHELRTPLNAVLGWCVMLRERHGHNLERALPVIERNARAQLKLVEDLLDASRMTAAKLTIRPNRLNLCDVLSGVLDAVRPVALERGVALYFTDAREMLPLWADADRLRQVLLYVLNNALKFTEPGGLVNVDVKSRDSWAQVVVRDTGRGIPPVMLPHIFEPFRRGVTDAASGGLGLGLSICRALIHLHGGTIDLESRGVDQGTTCTIELPLEAGAIAPPPGESAALR
jgi:signal transduction histidine kinase